MVKKEEVKKTFKKVTTNVDTIDTNNDGFADQKVVVKTVKTKNTKVTTVEDNTDDKVDAAPPLTPSTTLNRPPGSPTMDPFAPRLSTPTKVYLTG